MHHHATQPSSWHQTGLPVQIFQWWQAAMNANSSKAHFEEMTCRAGMHICGGNLTQPPQPDLLGRERTSNAAWAKHGMGLFVVDHACQDVIELESVMRRDIIICAVALNDASTYGAAGKHRFQAKSSDMTMLFVPRGERFNFATHMAGGLKSVTILVDLMSVMDTYGITPANLPASLLRTIRAGEIVVDKLVPSHFGSIAKDVASRPNIFPTMAPLYYEGKTLELLSALLSQLSRRDDLRAGNGVFNAKTLESLERVKQRIEQAPDRLLDIDALALEAAMNRTKLRSSFKRAYGMTLSDHRTSVLLRDADRMLRETDITVQQAAHLAGYAAASSFIVAYKRHFGMLPGEAKRN